VEDIVLLYPECATAFAKVKRVSGQELSFVSWFMMSHSLLHEGVRGLGVTKQHSCLHEFSLDSCMAGWLCGCVWGVNAELFKHPLSLPPSLSK
jgi:hypothetical protein